MLEDLDIVVSDEIRHVISADRHSIIHKGNIVSGKSFKVLDKLLRQLLVQLIKYNGPTIDTPKGTSSKIPIFESPDRYPVNN
ncbi:hypothetical protein BCY89_26755 [Sphingobacterium siyangense]|uniref:Uncharacterized protein n=1 Tax=Sphingobacterium siyangense TaxID=459529 RepID=A0A420G0E9_9SPHI|nr:hypothetical protein BCY89_26755 [Sphingobacterium siyangense]